MIDFDNLSNAMDCHVFGVTWDSSEFEVEIESELSAEAPLAREEITSSDTTSNESISSSFDDIYEINKQACCLLSSDVEDSENESGEFANRILSDERYNDVDLEAEQMKSHVAIDSAVKCALNENENKTLRKLEVSRAALKCVKTKILCSSIPLDTHQDKRMTVISKTNQNVSKDKAEVRSNETKADLVMINQQETESSKKMDKSEAKSIDTEADVLRNKSSERFAADLHKARLLRQRLLAAQAQSSVALTEKLKQILEKNAPKMSIETDEVDVAVSNHCSEENAICESFFEVRAEQVCVPDSPKSESISTDDMVDDCISCDEDDWDEILRNN